MHPIRVDINVLVDGRVDFVYTFALCIVKDNGALAAERIDWSCSCRSEFLINSLKPPTSPSSRHPGHQILHHDLRQCRRQAIGKYVPRDRAIHRCVDEGHLQPDHRVRSLQPKSWVPRALVARHLAAALFLGRKESLIHTICKHRQKPNTNGVFIILDQYAPCTKPITDLMRITWCNIWRSVA